LRFEEGRTSNPALPAPDAGNSYRVIIVAKLAAKAQAA